MSYQCQCGAGLRILSAMLFLILSSVSGRSDEIDDCNSDVAAIAKRGCDAVISLKLLSGAELALAYSRRADLARGEKNYDQALADRTQAVVLSPADIDFKRQLLGLQVEAADAAQRAGDALKSWTIYREALVVWPKEPGLLRAFTDLAIRLNRFDEAKMAVTGAGGNASTDPTIRSLFVRILVEQGRFGQASGKVDAAEQVLSEALQLDSTSLDALKLRGATRLQAGKYDAALADLDKYIAATSSQSDGYILRADLNRRRNQLSVARIDAETAVRLQDNNLDARLLRGLILEAQGDFGTALLDFDKAASIDPGNLPARESVDRVRQAIAASNQLAQRVIGADTRVRITRFVTERYVEAGVIGQTDLSETFVEQVMYFGKLTDRAKVEDAKRNYYRKWAERHYAIKPETLTIETGADANTFVVKYEFDFRVSNMEQNVAGQGTTELVIVTRNSSLLINSENGKVTRRTITENVDTSQCPTIDDGLEEVGGGWWTHNGSEMRLQEDGATRKFIYTDPRKALVDSGISNGTILFDGRRCGARVWGRAYSFSRKCGRLSFLVTGEISDKGVILGGTRDQRDASCNITGTLTERLVFQREPRE